jgi:SAM-dependent methyltransferase/uncharacterized protein YbaR (Trm112 family)
MRNEPLYHQLEGILRCPITKENLRLLSSDEIVEINDRVSKEELAHKDGTKIRTALETGFISSGGGYAYAVIEGVVVLLPNLAIPLDGRANNGQDSLSPEEKVVQDFYDQIGWRKGEADTAQFVDALKWEDLRPVAGEYVHQCHLRVSRYLKPHGKYFLDAGSGPIQYDEYLTYSAGYEFRICLDLSLLALREAQKKLGEKGIYILGDITNIPLQDGTVDGAVAIHVIYHVPEDKQLTAIREIHRVLKLDSSATIVYSWGTHSSLFVDFFLFPIKLKKAFKKLLQKLRSYSKSLFLKLNKQQPKPRASLPEKPYHHTHDYAYFVSHLKDLKFSILVWRSVGTAFTRSYIHSLIFGKQIMRWIFHLEDRFPRLGGRIGQYPLFIIEK